MEIEDIKALGVEDEELATRISNTSYEEVKGLKDNQASLLAEKKNLVAKIEAFEGVDPDEYKELKARAEELENKTLKEEGEFEKLREKMEKQWQDKLNVKEEKINNLMSMVRHDRKSAAINEAVRKHNGVSALSRVLASSVQAVDKDGEVVLQVTSDDGSPVIGDDGKPIDIDGYVESLKSDDEYAGLFKSSGLSGSGTKNSYPGVDNKTMKRNTFDNLSQAERVNFSKQGGRAVD